MKRFLIMFGALCALTIFSGTIRARCANGAQNDAETAIRTALCEIENENFKAAQATLEAVLKKDPKNVYALRLLPGVAARQIRDGDKSPENAATIKKAIEAYEAALVNPIFKNERAEINDYILMLYERIGRAERSAALLKKAENPAEEPEQRAAFYISLAADNYVCANEISDLEPVKTTAQKNGRAIYVFRKPQNPADFDKLKKCAAKGSAWIDKAIALNPASDTAWSYRASLFSQHARIAEMENKPDEKARMMKEFDAARAKFSELAKKRADEQARLSNEKVSSSPNDAQNPSFAALSDGQLKEFAEDLKAYRAARTLAETVERIDIPRSSLVAPISLEDEPDSAPTEPVRADDEKQKRELKIFAPEGGFSAELPANAAVSATGDSRVYTASGNGLAFFIVETARSRALSETEQDVALNVLARIFAKFIGGRFVGDGRWNDRFDLQLTRKDKFNDLPARFYGYRRTSCRETTEGAMIFVLGGKKNYAIDIRGAGESDERVRKFLKSLKLD